MASLFSGNYFNTYNLHYTACNDAQRSLFNHNLVDMLRDEWRRGQSLSAGRVESVDSDNVERRQAVEWKFSTLDADADRNLTRAEMADMRRLVKRALRPRPCARSFARYCDLDQSGQLSLQEWSFCLLSDAKREGTRFFNCCVQWPISSRRFHYPKPFSRGGGSTPVSITT